MSAFAGLAAFAAVLLVAPRAVAFCRTVTATPPAGYDPAASGCFDSQGGPGVYDVYWANLCVGYSLNSTASPLRGITLQQATAVAESAFAAWSAVSCPAGGTPSIKAVDQGAVDCAQVEYNEQEPNQHVIVFRDNNWPYSDSSNTLGLTTVTYDTTDGEIYDADMELNSEQYDLVATPPAPQGAYDLLTVVTHEAGHFLGLAHSADLTAVMYAHYHAGASLPTADDIAGICSIYPGDGTRVTNAGPLTGCACDATPRHGFSSQCGSSLAPAANPTQNDGICDSGGGSGGSGGGTGGSKCSVGRASTSATGTYGPLGLVALALAGSWVRRWRQRARRARAQGAVVAVLALVSAGSAGAIGLVSRDASASVSVAATFEDMVRQSTAVAAVTPIERQVQWEDGRIVTYTRVRVDSSVAGELPQDVWVRTLGGEIGKVGQIVEGEPSFVVGQPSLVFLRARARGFEVTARAQGQFAIVAGADKVSRLVSARNVGAILPAATASRVARDVLEGRELQDASREIAATWARVHTK